MIAIRVNGGAIDGGHWTQSSDEGGGRILGEACHFVDLARAIAGAPITFVRADAATQSGSAGDDVTASIGFKDGSLATLIYTGSGDTAVAKERVEVFAGGRAAVLDDFRVLTLAAGGKTVETKSTQDKGHTAQLTAFLAAVRGERDAPIPEDQLIEVSMATIAILDSLRSGDRIAL